MILDTNALSAAADGESNVLAVITQAEKLAVPAIVLGEYRLGIAQSRHRTEYENWLSEWLTAVAVLDIGRETSNHYARVGLELKRAGTPIPANDLWIAALCRQHALPVVSRDRHFDCVGGIQRLDW